MKVRIVKAEDQFMIQFKSFFWPFWRYAKANNGGAVSFSDEDHALHTAASLIAPKKIAKTQVVRTHEEIKAKLSHIHGE